MALATEKLGDGNRILEVTHTEASAPEVDDTERFARLAEQKLGAEA